MPPRTFGIDFESTYIRWPGRETRRRPEITDVRFSVYLSFTRILSAAEPGTPGASS
jgi:hypothetical protein